MKNTVLITLTTMVMIGLTVVRADLKITTDTTQNGGTFEFNPTGTLTISDPANNPLLTLTGGAKSSGIYDVVIGEWSGERGNLLVEQGSKLVNVYNCLLGLYAGAEGTVKVTNMNSQWRCDGIMDIGGLGYGMLNVEDGGIVDGSYCILASQNNSKGAVLVTGPGAKLRISNSLIVGSSGNGSLSIERGGFISSQTSVLGHVSGSAATALVTDVGSQWQVNNYLTVGNAGNAKLDIENGGFVSCLAATLANQAGTTGNVNVIGIGTKWVSVTDLDIGYLGVGVLHVGNGGLVTSSSGYLGTLAKSSGTVTISDHESRWQIAFSLVVGDRGAGTLNVENGGTVTTRYSTYIGYQIGSYGMVTVTGIGSELQNNANLYVGVEGLGILNVENGGQVRVAGVLFIGSPGTLSGNSGTIIGDVVNDGLIAPGNSPGVLTIDGDLTSTSIVQIQLAGTGSGLFDQLIVTGALNLGGTVELDLINGFDPNAHSSFKVLDFAKFTDTGYSFDLSHAALHNGLSWDFSTFETDGTIRVVPEASSLMLAGMAVLGGLFVWRKR